MTVAVLSCFHFERVADRLWALLQMQRGHAALRRAPDLLFYKLCGSGRNFASPLWPNWSVYGVISVWPDLPTAQRATLVGRELEDLQIADSHPDADARARANAALFAAYEARAAERLTLFLDPLWSKGRWAGDNPFGAEAAPRDAAARDVGPLAVLTRATLRGRGLRPFWRSAPAVDAAIAADPSVRFKIGLGELPWRNQVTFSVWPDLAAMRRFAYQSPAHADAARSAFGEGWFEEDLFARFRLLGAHGSWRGAPAAALTAAQERPVPAPA